MKDLKITPHNLIKVVFIVLAFLVIGSCEQKDEILPIEDDILNVTTDLHLSFYNFDIFGGNNNSIFEVENFGLNGIYALTRTQADDLVGNDKLLFECIKSVNPSLIQLISIKNSTDNFSLCRKAITPALIQDITDTQIEYNELRNALVIRFENKEINEEALLLGLLKLRNDLKNKVIAIKKKYDEPLKKCLYDYISGINKTLKKEQWKQFKACIL